MTPLDFLEFRDYLYPASGFQSFQFRLLETKLGLKEADRLNYNEGPFYKYLTPQQQIDIKELLKQPSLFELMDQWLARTPFLRDETFCFWSTYQETVEKMFAGDMKVIQDNPLLSPEAKERNLQMMKGSLETFKALFNEKEYQELQKRGIFKLSYPALHGALLIQLYRDQAILQTPFKVIKTLMDIDELITQWRYRHSLMAHRMLGTKIGTGGSSGHQYLKDSTEKHKLFSDFFNLSTFFIPRNQLPKLPEGLTKKMGFPTHL
jgi:tryptophan 2,3-dioxygenase